MKANSIRAVGAALMMLGLVACGSNAQEDEFVEVMAEQTNNSVVADTARCIYGKLIESKGQEWVTKIVKAGDAMDIEASVAIAGALAKCAD
ncbi:MAG: hypothetical protein E2O92_09975 [Alphaproteobacteria bacterium]|nr:MAG: hypothetical protein E2O92_09975 [Alphaproteobacteria bacterium]